MGCGTSVQRVNIEQDQTIEKKPVLISLEPEHHNDPVSKKRLLLYTSSRPGSVSSALLDRIATPQDEKFYVWQWDLLNQLRQINEMKYSMFGGQMNPDQQKLFGRLMEHKHWLDSFSEVYIGVALHNFHLNVEAKTYLDVIIQPGIAFDYNEGRPKGLMKDNKWHIVAAAGGEWALGNPEGDYATPWLKHVLKFMGITQVAMIAAKGTGSPTFDVAGVPLEDVSL